MRNQNNRRDGREKEKNMLRGEEKDNKDGKE